MGSECQLGGHFKSCCCGCVNQVKLLNNDVSDLPHVGWGCAVLFVLEGKVVMTGDFEHGLCELHQPRDGAEADERRLEKA